MSPLMIFRTALSLWRRAHPPSASSARNDAETLAYATAVLAATREELDRADQKAAILLAGSGVGIGALIAGLLAGSWSPFQLHNAVEWLWWLGVAFAAVAVTSLGSSLYPRTKRHGEPPGIVAYYGDVLALSAADSLEERLRRSAQSSIARVADQLRQGSRIAALKYRLIQTALWLLAGAVASCTIAVLVNLRFA